MLAAVLAGCILAACMIKPAMEYDREQARKAANDRA